MTVRSLLREIFMLPYELANFGRSMLLIRRSPCTLKTFFCCRDSCWTRLASDDICESRIKTWMASPDYLRFASCERFRFDTRLKMFWSKQNKTRGSSRKKKKNLSRELFSSSALAFSGNFRLTTRAYALCTQAKKRNIFAALIILKMNFKPKRSNIERRSQTASEKNVHEEVIDGSLVQIYGGVKLLNEKEQRNVAYVN